jgi:hypothetical protein
MQAFIILTGVCIVASFVHAIPSTKSRRQLMPSSQVSTARGLVRGGDNQHEYNTNDHQNNFGPISQRSSSTAVSVVAYGADAEKTIIFTALNSIATLLSTCGFGVYFSKVGLIDDNTLGVLSKLIFNVFQPAFLFSNVFKIVAQIMAGTEKNVAIALLPAMAFIQLCWGMTLGKIMTKLLYGG